MRDIEWLVQKINTERENLRQRFESGRETADENAFNDGRDSAFVAILRLINHLDETEMLSQEWIDKNKKGHPDTAIEDHEENDMVNSPSHYNQGPIEVIDIIQASMTPEMFKGYLLGNVLKYMLRAPYKGNQEQDHEKAKWYYNKLRSVDDENE